MAVWLAGLVFVARSLRWAHRAVVLLGVVAALAVTHTSAAQEPAHITRVEPYASRDAARVVLYASAPVSFERGGGDAAEAATRLYVDLPGAEYSGATSFELKGLLRRVRVEPGGSKLRVQLELSEATYMDETPPYAYREDLARRLKPQLRTLLELFLSITGRSGSDPDLGR